MIEQRALFLGLPDLRAGEFCPFFDIPDDRVFHFVPVFGQQFAQGQIEIPRPPDAKDLVGVFEIRRRLLNDAAQVGKYATLAFEHRGHAGVHRQAAQRRTPGNRGIRKRSLKRLKELLARFTIGNRHARVRPGHDAQQQRHILHGTSHWPLDGKREPADPVRPGGHAAGRGPKPHHIAKTGRIAQRAAQVAAIGNRQHPGRQRHRSSTATATTGRGEIIWVECLPKYFVIRLRAGPELGRIRLADGNSAGRTQAFDNNLVLVGNKVGKDRRAERSAYAFSQDQILVGNGQAVQRADLLASPERCIGLGRPLQSMLRQQGHNRVYPRIDVIDPR